MANIVIALDFSVAISPPGYHHFSPIVFSANPSPGETPDVAGYRIYFLDRRVFRLFLSVSLGIFPEMAAVFNAVLSRPEVERFLIIWSAP
jgi:hypothetical protein